MAHQAAANGETETLMRAIRADPTILEHKDVDGKQIHHIYESFIHTYMYINVYYPSCDSVNYITFFYGYLTGLTPLIHAVMAEQLDSVKLLVKMGASINTCDSMGRTCLSMAAYQVC